MKRLNLLLFTLFLASATLLAQPYQRMLIPAGAGTGIVNPGESIKTPAICLDYFRDVPPLGANLDHIIQGSNAAIVHFTDGKFPLTASLNSLLGKGVNISGTNQLEISVLNNTGRPFKVIFQKNVQFSNKPELPGVFYSKIQDEQWNKQTERYKERLFELGYQGEAIDVVAKFKYDFKITTQLEFEKILNREYTFIYTNRNYSKHLARLCVYSAQDFLQKLPDGLRNIGDLQKNIELYYAKCLALEKKHSSILNRLNHSNITDYFQSKGINFLNFQETELLHEYQTYLKKEDYVKLMIKKYDVGIKGETSKEIFDNYSLAANNKISSSNLEQQLKKDFQSKMFYVREKDKYYRFIKSLTLKNKDGSPFLFKYSDFTSRNLEYLEKALSSKKINADQVYLLNFLDVSEDAKTMQTLKKLFPGKYSDFNIQSLGKLKQKIKSNNVKHVFCFGHYNNGKIFTTIKGEIHGVDTKILNKIAQELGIDIVYLGCKSSYSTQGGAGTLENVNSIELLQNVAESLNSSKTVAEFLSNLDEINTFEFDDRAGLVKVVFNKKKKKSTKNQESESAQKAKNQNTKSETFQNTVVFPFRMNPSMLNFIPNQKNDKDENKPTKNQ